MKKFIYLSLLAVLVAACHPLSRVPNEKIFTITPSEFEKLKLSYYSDYFSFVGEDEKGKVALALDNNRGQDGDKFQAEHFVCLHDEKKGWVKMRGSGIHPNPKKELDRIPDTDFFQFTGTPETGIRIQSRISGLELLVSPIPKVLAHQKGLASYWLGSASATLEWVGRKIRGRVIYEYLFLPAFNRMTRSYIDLWEDSHGIYVVVDGVGDFYIHHQRSQVIEPLIGSTEGFFVCNGVSQSLERLEMAVVSKTLGPGFFWWPASWKGNFKIGSTPYQFTAELSERMNVSNWVIGGFAMGIVKGVIKKGNKVFYLYGLGELLI
jgi:hypothetical protein